MKKLAILLAVLFSLSLTGCNRGQVINGQNMKTAFRSIKGLKERLPSQSRIEFEVAFWTLRDANKEESAFLSVVDGKKPQEIVEMAKVVYQERKNAGFKEYAQYTSWEDMIDKFSRERMDQENHKGPAKAGKGDESKNNVLYKL